MGLAMQATRPPPRGVTCHWGKSWGGDWALGIWHLGSLNNRQDAEIAKKGMIIKPISTLAWRTWRLGGSNRFEVIQRSHKHLGRGSSQPRRPRRGPPRGRGGCECETRTRLSRDAYHNPAARTDRMSKSKPTHKARAPPRPAPPRPAPPPRDGGMVYVRIIITGRQAPPCADLTPAGTIPSCPPTLS